MSDATPDPIPPPGAEPEELEEIREGLEDRRYQAAAYFRQAYAQQMKGDLAGAERYYRKSIELCPTAEAYTFLGWTYSFMGRLTDAIALCKQAIATDPDFGNPYNDIGAYLIELGHYEDAVPYLKQALQASRYDAPHYPHFNLGRALEAIGDWKAALREYRAALELHPDYKLAYQHMVKLQARLN
ncbi:MAG TPA: tetratricopeptide repeat protein [bacterium]|nr:tetratricopeptide repeat protein [bacterium]